MQLMAQGSSICWMGWSLNSLPVPYIFKQTNMKKFLVFGFFTVSSFIGNQLHGQAGTRLTLKQCVETGIANNLLVGQSYFQAQTDSISWKQAKWNRFPDFNASAIQGINQGRSIDPFSNSYINQQVSFASYSISSGVILFNGFSLQNRVKQNELIHQASKMDLQQAKDDLTINIILAYLQILSNEDLLRQLEGQAELTTKQVERLEIMNREGAIAPSLLYDLKGQYANDQLNIINTRNALESAKLDLCQLMNILYDKNMELERLDLPLVADTYQVTPDKIYEVALQQFSLVKAAGYRTQSNQAAIKVAKGELFPTLSFSGNASTNYSNAARQEIFINNTTVATTDYVTVNNVQYPVITQKSNYSSQKIGYGSQLENNLFTSFSLNLRIPIFNSFQARNRVKLAMINLKSSELNEKTTKTQLQQSIEQAYVNMNTALDRYKILLDQVNSFTESFRSADIRFNAGAGTSVDYLIAKNNLDRSNLALITAKYDYILRRKILDYYQGKHLW
jgi:outer membrane protein